MVSDARLAAQLNEIDQLAGMLDVLAATEDPKKVADVRARLDGLRTAVEHALYAHLDEELEDLGDEDR